MLLFTKGLDMNIENLSPIAAAIGGGFFVGALMGYALKKVAKIAAVVVGLFFAGLAYLQYQQILNINWDKLQAISQHSVIMLANATTQISNHLSNITGGNNHTTALAFSNMGIPLTGSIAMGFTIGFMKG
jgi:uncharacterized membrane protein (Fun14 family)